MPNVIVWALLGRAFYDASYPVVKVPYSETGRSAASANGKWKWYGPGVLLLLVWVTAVYVLLKFGHLVPVNGALGIAALAFNAAALAFTLAFHLVGPLLHNRRFASVPLSQSSTDSTGKARSLR